MSAAPPQGHVQPGTRMGDPGEVIPQGHAETASFLDAGACLELLGSLYPLSASMLFFHLEAFLRESDLAGEMSVPRRLLLANLDPTRTAGLSSGMSLEPVGVDVVVEHNPAAQDCTIGFVPAGMGPSSSGRPRQCEGARLHVHIQEESGLSKWVNVPLQILISGWGDVSSGFQGFAHIVEFVDGDGASLERWTYVGVSSGNWMARMDDFEREIRAGSNRRFSAAWQKYVGAARVVLHSELVMVNQTEDAVLDWEEREIAKLAGASGNLNVAPGGLAGMRMLFEKGVLAAPRVPIKEREDALASWVTRRDASTPPPELRHMVALAWHRDQFVKPESEYNGDTLTPAMLVQLRSLFRAGETAESIALSIGAKNLSVVQAAIAAIDARH